MTYNIIEVTKSDYRQVAVFTAKLLSELRGTTVSSSNYLVTSQQLIQHNPQWTGFLIYDESVAIGFLSLYQSTALYANGDLGIIQELYVEPSYRNRGVGSQLIHQAVTYGKTVNWQHIEVGTPNITRWPRTLHFYENQNFTTIGSRLKLYLHT
ncbi:GNAT family N-acetyltransferase [Staphylococcus arlettae]|uniref:GNAT family N-acetyltransferase n=1 Tax=Staphylococcus arlettae TaxID=29378 RepID=UPI0021CEAABF|nr:GNAT family N-acetyltransferase [Staphylococcus arlettae]UXU48870.1 GNAT family N-acetyltransferase [Staphylococcus arlettae]UXU51493.1 GNAT family N-acetyltransferase [Staphylococcus arlettae]